MKKKSFDCVDMKNQIQADLLREYEGLNDEQIQERRRQRIDADPLLRDLLRKVGLKEVKRSLASKR